MARPEKTIFISYRRKDMSWALLVYKYLTAKGYDVFFDYTSIPSGDFEQIIVGNIKARAHFILILTPTALDRCSEPGDWLRREIETAISERRNVIPLFFDGFNFGAPSVSEKLSGNLEGLKRYNGLEVPVGYFDEAMEKLRSRYLRVTLDAVLHPVSDEVQKVVEEQRVAADQAISRGEVHEESIRKEKEDRKHRNIGDKTRKALEKPFPGISVAGRKLLQNINFKGIGLGGVIVLVLLFLIFGGNFLIQNLPASNRATATKSPSITPILSPTITPTGAMTVTPTETLVPTPTLGVGSIMTSEKDGMKLVYIPAGEFEMGSENGEANEKKVQTLNLSAFWIDQTEVTNAMYSQCVQTHQCDQPMNLTYYNDPSFADHPVVYVSWYAAEGYCIWAGHRLPTEAEWEKAARGGFKRKTYPWGDETPVCEKGAENGAQFDSCSGRTAPVANFGENGYGLYDMAGNVWEWVSTIYQPYPYSATDGREDISANDNVPRVLRGGSWAYSSYLLRSAYREKHVPRDNFNDIGFRCALSASE